MILTLTDPNDNSKSRFQYTVSDWLLLRRRLPPEALGDVWRDDPYGSPWWEPVLELPPFPIKGNPISEFWSQHASASVAAHEYAFQAKYLAAHVVMYTPNGREVRHAPDGGGYEVQPCNDNYWITCPTMTAIRRAYFRCDDPQDVALEDDSDVQSIEYRLHPVDVGFDLVAGGFVISIAKAAELRVSYMARNGSCRVMSGAWPLVIAKLVSLGYRIAER